MQGDRIGAKTEEEKDNPESLIENDSDKSMRAQQTKRIDHITIDNELSESEEDEYNQEVEMLNSNFDTPPQEILQTKIMNDNFDITDLGKGNFDPFNI